MTGIVEVLDARVREAADGCEPGIDLQPLELERDRAQRVEVRARGNQVAAGEDAAGRSGTGACEPS